MVCSAIGNDAEEYVQSIMTPELVTRVGTPLVNGRKRHLSAPSSNVKGDLNELNSLDPPGFSPGALDSSPSPTMQKESKKARRSVINSFPSPQSGGRLVVTGADVHVSAESSVEKLITKLAVDVREMFSDLSCRIDRLESGLEQRISSKVAQLLDKRVNVELNRIKRDVDNHIDSFKESLKAEVAADIADVSDRIDNLRIGAATSQPDLSRNLIIRNLPESTNEKIDSKVNSIFRDGLKINNVLIECAERKVPQEGSNKPGVVVVTMKSASDKQKVMSVKRKLKDHRQYATVYINHDKTKSERLIEDNFRAILSAVRQRDTNLTLRGSRVVRSENGNGDGRRRPPSPSSRDSRRSVNRSPSVSVNRDKPPRGDRSRGSEGRNDSQSRRGGPRVNRR